MWTPENIARLKVTCEKDLRSGIVQRENWLKLRQGHAETIELLKILPTKTSHRALVPISSIAFVEGDVERTNEVMLSLGAGYLALCTPEDAVAVFERRLQRIDEIVAGFDSQQVHNEKKMEILQQFLDEEPFLIYEPLEEDEKGSSSINQEPGIGQQNEAGEISGKTCCFDGHDAKASDQGGPAPVTDGRKRVSWAVNAESRPEMDKEVVAVSKPAGKAVHSILKVPPVCESEQTCLGRSTSTSATTKASRFAPAAPAVRAEVVERSGSPERLERTDVGDATKRMSKFRLESKSKRKGKSRQVEPCNRGTD